MINSTETIKKREPFTVPRISNELNNQANCILSNSQFLLDTWEEIFSILFKLKKSSHQANLLVNGIPLKELKIVIPKIIKSNIRSAGKISGIANLLNGLDQFGEFRN